MPLFGPPDVDKLKGKRKVNRLIKALMVEDASVRKSAAEALGSVRDARAVEPLSAALKDDDKDVRKRAASSLAKLGLKPDEIGSLQAKSRGQVERARLGLVAGSVLPMAMVCEGYVIEEPDPLAIANELLAGFSEAGVLTGVTLHPHSGIKIRRADESAWYRGDYEPGDELPQMLNEGIGLLRDRLLAAGQTMGRVNSGRSYLGAGRASSAPAGLGCTSSSKRSR